MGFCLYRGGWPSRPAAYGTNIKLDGTFNLRLFAGQNRLQISGLPLGYTVKSLVSGSKNILEETLDVDGLSTPSEIVATVVGPPQGVVSGVEFGGKVADLPTLRSPRALRVRLVQPGPARQMLETPLYPDGTFLFPAVPPGDYFQVVLGVEVRAGVTWPTITIGNTDVTDAVITLPASSTVPR